jgi:hypothetical protein
VTRTTIPVHPEHAIPDAHGLHWTTPNYLVDWINRLMLRDEQGPEWRFSAILNSFRTLPGDLEELLNLSLDVQNHEDGLHVVVHGGWWSMGGTHKGFGRQALFASVLGALQWLPAWRQLSTGTLIRVFAPAEQLDELSKQDAWHLGDRPVMEVGVRPTTM